MTWMKRTRTNSPAARAIASKKQEVKKRYKDFGPRTEGVPLYYPNGESNVLSG
jgi:hypothetical protein